MDSWARHIQRQAQHIWCYNRKTLCSIYLYISTELNSLLYWFIIIIWCNYVVIFIVQSYTIIWIVFSCFHLFSCYRRLHYYWHNSRKCFWKIKYTRNESKYSYNRSMGNLKIKTPLYSSFFYIPFKIIISSFTIYFIILWLNLVFSNYVHIIVTIY